MAGLASLGAALTRQETFPLVTIGETPARKSMACNQLENMAVLSVSVGGAKNFKKFLAP